MFEEVHPCRTTGRKDGQADGLVAVEIACQAVQDFGAFFHDGEVGCEIGVEYIVESQFAQGVYHFSGYQCARGESEFFSQGSAYGRCGLHDDYLVRVCQVIEQAVGVITFG